MRLTPRLTRGMLVWATALAAVGAVGADAQGRTVRLQLDNDAYNFWLPPDKRTDEEYTNGVRLLVDGGESQWWASGLWRSVPGCAARRGKGECRTSRWWIGQDIYNGRRDDRQKYFVEGSRPNAGWLYYGGSLSRADDVRLTRVELTLGVTGPPSLAQAAQQFAHDLAPELNRPIDWSTQIAFEPGAIVGGTIARRAMASAAGIDFEVVPSLAGSAGNVLTEVRGGVRARVGVGLGSPWIPPTTGAAEVALLAGYTGRAVARDLFLDGNTFRDGPRVGHEPIVGERELGVSMRWRRFGLEFVSTRRTPAYRGAESHTWSSMRGTLDLHR